MCQDRPPSSRKTKQNKKTTCIPLHSPDVQQYPPPQKKKEKKRKEKKNSLGQSFVVFFLFFLNWWQWIAHSRSKFFYDYVIRYHYRDLKKCGEIVYAISLWSSWTSNRLVETGVCMAPLHVLLSFLSELFCSTVFPFLPRRPRRCSLHRLPFSSPSTSSL